MYSKEDLFKFAVEITKEAARGGNATPSGSFSLTFEKLKEIAETEEILDKNK